MILSAKTVGVIVEKGINEKVCEVSDTKELYSRVLGSCMKKLDIKLVEDLDGAGKRTLFPYQPDQHICLKAKRADDFESGYNKGNVTCVSLIVSLLY